MEKLQVAGGKRTPILLGITLLSVTFLLYTAMKTQPKPVFEMGVVTSVVDVESKSTEQNRNETMVDRVVDVDVADEAVSADDILIPPSQDWIQEQMKKSIEFRGLSYGETSSWDRCGGRTYYFPNINTVYTGVPKTGCSNWIEALLRAEGDLKEQLDPTKVRRVHGRLSGRHRMKSSGPIFQKYTVEDIDNAFSFAVVRNPWTRMVSGFRDKVSSEETQGGSFRGIGKGIVRRMRGVTDEEELKTLYPTFTEFARWLVVKQSPGVIDGHFSQQWRTLCTPKVKYDMIVPLEYSANLVKEIWSRTGVEDLPILKSYDQTSDPRIQSSALKAKQWLMEIESETIEKLYKIYEADFIMMNYSNFTDPNFPLPLHDL